MVKETKFLGIPKKYVFIIVFLIMIGVIVLVFTFSKKKVGPREPREPREPICWFADTRLNKYLKCNARDWADYTCAGVFCAAMDPGGDHPERCAAKQPAGYILDSSTGTCVPGGEG